MLWIMMKLAFDGSAKGLLFAGADRDPRLRIIMQAAQAKVQKLHLASDRLGARSIFRRQQPVYDMVLHHRFEPLHHPAGEMVANQVR